MSCEYLVDQIASLEEFIEELRNEHPSDLATRRLLIHARAQLSVLRTRLQTCLERGRLPNLIVQHINVVSTANGPWHISARIKNIGNSPVSGPFFVDMGIDGANQSRYRRFEVPAAVTLTPELVLSATARTIQPPVITSTYTTDYMEVQRTPAPNRTRYDVTVLVDAEHQISESNEGDNYSYWKNLLL